MSNPVLVETLRGSWVESRHRGAVAMVDADGRTVLALGDVTTPIFPRSAVKAIQALPLVESGAADDFDLSDAELALACASHAGEPAHVGTCAAMLRRAARGSLDLECGAHRPMNDAAARALAETGAAPSALHNNCSGKHAGFICLARAMGEEPRGYSAAGHPVQRDVTAALGGLTGIDMAHAPRGTDGCGIPAFAIPLSALARAFARFGTGHGLAPARARAAARLRAAVTAHPHLVGGTGRFDTDIISALGARAFTKTGAEGVFCAALPEQGLGLAVKCDDGAGRAAELVTATLIARFLKLTDAQCAPIRPRLAPMLRNWSGTEVGSLRPTSDVLGQRRA